MSSVSLHPIGGADGGVEGGVGVAEAVGAGGFEGAIEVAQGPAVSGHDLAAQGAQGNGGFGDCANFARAEFGMRLAESVNCGQGKVSKTVSGV